MSTSALRIALGAQLNACARSMMVAWGSVVAAVDEQLEVPAPMDFPAYSPSHVVLVARVGELGRDLAFELALLEREIERQAQTYRRTIEAMLSWRSRPRADPAPERYAHAQALADRIDAFVEVLLSDGGEPEPGTPGPKSDLPNLDVIVRRIGNSLARNVQSGQGALHGALASRFGLNPRLGNGGV